MTDTINDVAAKQQEGAGEPAMDEQGVAEKPVAQARAKGIEWPAGRAVDPAHETGAGRPPSRWR